MANLKLKVITRLAGPDDQVLVCGQKGREHTKQAKAKWQLIFIHKGCRSFATLSLKRGIKRTP